MYNKLLQKQLKKHLGSVDEIPKKLLPVFKSISACYDEKLSNTDDDELINKLREENNYIIIII